MIGDKGAGGGMSDAGHRRRTRRALTMSFGTSISSSDPFLAKLTARTGAIYGCEEGVPTKRLNRLLIDAGLIEAL